MSSERLTLYEKLKKQKPKFHSTSNIFFQKPIKASYNTGIIQLTESTKNRKETVSS